MFRTGAQWSGTGQYVQDRSTVVRDRMLVTKKIIWSVVIRIGKEGTGMHDQACSNSDSTIRNKIRVVRQKKTGWPGKRTG